MAEFSANGVYLATGGADSILKIWRVLDESDFSESQYDLFEKEPYWVFEEHHLDIIAIAWCPININMILSSGLDHKVI